MSEFSRLADDLEFYVFVSASATSLSIPGDKRFHRVEMPLDNRNRFLRYAWEQSVLPFECKRLGLHLLHSLNYVGPLWGAPKNVITIHDANWSAVGRTMSRIKRIGLRTISKLAAQRGDVVTTDSNFSKSELIREFSLKGEKVKVIHLGCGWATEINADEELTDMRLRYQLRSPFIAAFGGGYPHKNLGALFTAYQGIAGDIPHDLVVIGGLSNDVKIDEIHPLVRPRIKLLGHVPTADVGKILQAAELLAFPSLYEGFGFPVLEAQRHSTPVVCSYAAAIPEIAGKGALFFDPTKPTQIGSAILRCLRDPELRSQLVHQGNLNVVRFSWSAAATAYLSLYSSLVTSPT